MNKQGQSLLDLINILPIQALQITRSALTSKEALTLFSIWNGSKDSDGNIVVDRSIDPFIVSVLTNKGVLKSKVDASNKIVEITEKGKGVIRNIILSEKSSFDTRSNQVDSILSRLLDQPISRSAKKIASRLQKPDNWLERALWRSF